LDFDIVEKAKTVEISRRSFLKKSAIITGAAMMSQSEILAATGERKVLKLYNVHLNKMFYAPFFEKNYYKLSGLFEVNKAFIDYRAKEMTRVDVKLINLLYEIKQHLGYDKQFNIVSGYRSPHTNEALRKRREGVAKNSYHIKGQAVDIYVPNVSLRKLRDVALGLKKGGVGYYPKSNFLHVDVGPVRSWRRG
jgi:uncharacterized protein YcbK (DUF882 family)